MADNRARANRQHRWTEEKMVNADGYVKLRVGRDHPLADPNGYAYEHLVIWCAAGRPRPAKGWLLHHKNEVKSDNRIDNLEMKRRGAHNALHNAQRGRDPVTGRLLPAGRSLDGVTHDGFPQPN